MKNESLRYRAWVDDAIAKVLAACVPELCTTAIHSAGVVAHTCGYVKGLVIITLHSNIHAWLLGKCTLKAKPQFLKCMGICWVTLYTKY